MPHQPKFRILHAKSILGGLLLLSLAASAAAHEGHDGHEHESQSSHRHATTLTTAAAMTNSFVAGEKTYRWQHRDDLGKQSDEMVAAAKVHLHNNADQDLQTNEIVTVVSRYGLVTLDAELANWKLVGDQDAYFAAGMNAHGADCFVSDGESYWAFASTNTREVVICKRGKIIAKLSKPAGTEFTNETINKYYADGGRFVPCDVVYAPEAKSLFVVTGYAPGDYALTAKLIDGTWQWSGAAWGGKTNQGGPFSTAHGVEVTKIDGKEVIEVASRTHGRIYGFDSAGNRLAIPGCGDQKFIQLPAKSNPCNLSHDGDAVFLPLLNPLDDTNGVAPVLVVKDGQPVGRLVPADYTGLQYMHHMHGFCPVQRDGKLYGIVLSWPNGGENKSGKRNDGQIAIFEAVEIK